jgi:hypothetical protein
LSTEQIIISSRLRALLDSDTDQVVSDTVQQIVEGIGQPKARFLQTIARINNDALTVCFEMVLWFDFEDNRLIACLIDEIDLQPVYGFQESWTAEQEQHWQDVKQQVRNRLN